MADEHLTSIHVKLSWILISPDLCSSSSGLYYFLLVLIDYFSHWTRHGTSELNEILIFLIFNIFLLQGRNCSPKWLSDGY